MEHIGKILKQTRINISKANTGTWSGAEAEDAQSASSGQAPSAPVCPVCRGARFVHPLLPSGRPDFSQVVPCRCTQQALDKDRQARLQRYSNMGPLIHLTFDNLLPQGKSDNPVSQEQFSRACKDAIAFAAEPKGWLVLAGPSGSGKTHLAAAIARHCIDNNHPVFYITAPDLLDHLRSSFSPNSELPYDEFFEQVRNTPLLVLDDLGAQSSTPWAKEKLDQLLNHRFSNQLPTVVVSIVPITELEERLRTRLTNAKICQLPAVSAESSALFTSGWAPQFKKESDMTFDNFDWKRVNLPLEQRENLKTAFDFALNFAQSPEGWLVFQGDNGCGKTHLAAAIVNYRYQVKQPALFIVVPDLLDHLRSAFKPESEISYDQLFESVKSTPLLVLDDFGKQTTSPWAQEKLYQVINYRYNARLPMVVTTNHSIEEIQEIYSPIASRFADQKISTLFHIMAPHYFASQSNSKKTSGSRQKEHWS